MSGPATADRSENRAVIAGARPPLSETRPVVLFDGACPLCRREIAHYRRLRSAERVDWVDIAADEGPRERYGITRADAMARFHVRDCVGQWHVGAAGFVELWSHLPGYRRLAASVRLMRLVGPMDWAYQRFATLRLRRRCREDACASAHALGDPVRSRAHTLQPNHDANPN